MKQEYARVIVEMTENKDKKTLSQELTYEIENNNDGTGNVIVDALSIFR